MCSSVVIELGTFRFRLEKAITDLKPTSINDPTTNFWTVYKKVADEHDDDLLKKYTGDLDTSLLFVSIFDVSCVQCLNPFCSVPGGFVLCRLHNVHCPNYSISPTKPLRHHEFTTASHITTK